eukprot:6658-Heterococcus_DN1.PRE.7
MQSHHSYDNLKTIAPLTPLEHDGVLDVVFSMLGTKSWVIIAGVNRQWRDVYAAMVERKVTSAQHVVTSLALYECAKLCGKDFNALDSRMLGQYAGLNVLAAGAAADSPLSIVVEAAFASKRTDMLQLLQ